MRRLPDWLPLYGLALVVITTSPLVWTCGPGLLDPRLRPADFALNLLLFVPLGWSLVRLPRAAVLIVALLLSASLETLQLWLPRHPSAWDVLANLSGALLGHSLTGRALPRPGPGLLTWLYRLGAVAVLGFCALERPEMISMRLSGWESYPLVIGDEFDGRRPWHGTLGELAIYDSADASLEDSARPWRRGGPVLWLRFSQPVSGRLDGPRGERPLEILPPPQLGWPLTPEGLQVRGGPWILPEEAARHVTERLRESGALSVVARVRPGDLVQHGPARIVTLSAATMRRSFTLAQRRADVVLRVRTPLTGPNGSRPELATTTGPLDGSWQWLRASYGGGVGRIEVDGRCAEVLQLPTESAPWPWGLGISVSLVAATALCALAGAGLGGRRRGARGLGFALGGIAAWTLLWAGSPWSRFPEPDGPTVLLGLAALIAAAPLARPARS